MSNKQTLPTETERNKRRDSKWDLDNAFSNYSILVLGQVGTAFLSFVSVILLTKIIGTEGYGGIVAIITASQAVQMLVSWTCVALARFGVEEFIDSGKITNSFWARTLIFLPNTLFFIASSFLWYPVLANWLKLPEEAFWFVLVHFAATALWLHVQHAFQAVKLPQIQGIYLLIERVLILAILIGLMLTGYLNWYSAMLAYTIPSCLMTVAGLWFIRNVFSFKLEIDFLTLKKILKFSLPLIPFTLISYFSTNNLDAIFISQYLTKNDLGIYAIAYQIYGVFLQFPSLASNLLMPFFTTLEVTNETGKIENYLANILPILVLFLAIAFASLSFVAALTLPFILKENSEFIGKLLWILLPAGVFSSIVSLGYVPISFAKKYSDLGFITALGGALTNILLDFILIPRFGLVGCAIATVFSSLVFASLFVILIHKRMELKTTWVWLTPLPIALGACTMLYFNSSLLAYIVILIVAAILLCFYRKSLFVTQTFLQTNIFDNVFSRFVK